jgi:hypothetical protein
MGNESSVPVSDDVPPATLRERTLEAVAEYIKEKDVRRIVVMVRILQTPFLSHTSNCEQRPVQVLALPQAYQTFGPQTQDSMQI